MTSPNAGWYDDGSGTIRWWDGQSWTDRTQEPAKGGGLGGVLQRIESEAVAGARPRPAPSPGISAGNPGTPAASASQPAAGGMSPGGMNTGAMNYVVLQVVLKEKFWGTGSGNLTELEEAINRQAALGYRLHTISTASSGSKGLGGGDRVQATLVFEKLP